MILVDKLKDTEAEKVALYAGQHATSEEYFLLKGPDICLNYVLLDANGSISLPLKTLFAQEMIRHEVLMPWIAISLAHGNAELEITLTAAEEALKVVSQALENDVENFLDGPAIKPVFRKNN